MADPLRKGQEQDGTPRRVEALEAELKKVTGRLDSLERSSRAIESDVRTMKGQISSMQSSIQEMLIVFRNLSEKVRQQAAGMQASRARLVEEDQRSYGSRQRGAADELVRDPRHMREDEDEGA